MTMNQGSSLPSTTPNKNKMMTSLLAHRHLLHSRREKNEEMMTSQGGSPSFATSKKKQIDEDETPSSSSSSSTLEEKTKRLVLSLHFSTYLPQMHQFWRNIFCNNTSTSSITLLQHHFYNIIFCSIVSTPLLQHCFLEHHFNIISIALSSKTSFLLLSGGEF